MEVKGASSTAAVVSTYSPATRTVNLIRAPKVAFGQIKEILLNVPSKPNTDDRYSGTTATELLQSTLAPMKRKLCATDETCSEIEKGASKNKLYTRNNCLSPETIGKGVDEFEQLAALTSDETPEQFNAAE